MGILDAPSVAPARMTKAETLLRVGGGAPPSKAQTVVLMGDSIISQNSSQYNTSGPTMRTYNAQGWYTQAMCLLGHRFKHLHNAGKSGENTTQMLSRYTTDVINKAPGYVIIGGPTNDVTAIANGSMTLTTSKSNLTSMWDQAESAGIQVVQCVVTPRNDDVSPQLADVPSQRSALFAINQWLREQARIRPKMVLVDWYSELSSGVTLKWKTGHTNPSDTSGLHPAPQGAYEMGRIFAERIAPLSLPVSVLPTSAVETANLVNSVTGSGAALAIGTTGTVGTGGSGQVATGWQVQPLPTASFTCRKVARTDTHPGEWQEVTVNSGQVKIGVNVTGFGTTYNTGDEIYAIAEFEADPSTAPATAGDFIRLNLVAMKSDFGVGTQAIDFDIASTVTMPTSAYFPSRGVFLTPLTVVPSTATLRMAFQFEVKATGGPRTVRVGRIGMYKKGTGPGADEWSRSDAPLS